MMVFTGNANPRLAQDVVKHLNIPARASDRRPLLRRRGDESRSWRTSAARDVFVLQSTCTPTNENLMELMVDGRRAASARRRARVSRGDPVLRLRAPGPAAALGAGRDQRAKSSPTCSRVGRASRGVLTMDLHADQIQGFFDIPVDNIYAAPVLLGDVWKQRYEDLIVVSPDVGGVVRARALAKRLESDLAIIDKRRPQANVVRSHERHRRSEGPHVRDHGRHGRHRRTRWCKAAQVLKEEGAKKVVAYCTHPVLSGGAIERIEGSDLDELVVTDTIPLQEDARNCAKIRQLSVAGLLAETILRIFTEESVSSLFIE